MRAEPPFQTQDHNPRWWFHPLRWSVLKYDTRTESKFLEQTPIKLN
jgi:hypothetical protein